MPVWVQGHTPWGMGHHNTACSQHVHGPMFQSALPMPALKGLGIVV